MKIREQAAGVAMKTIVSTIAAGESANKQLKVAFTLEKIVGALQKDLLLLPELKNPLAAAERAVTFLHEMGVIELQQGLAVFRNR